MSTNEIRRPGGHPGNGGKNNVITNSFNVILFLHGDKVMLPFARLTAAPIHPNETRSLGEVVSAFVKGLVVEAALRGLIARNIADVVVGSRWLKGA